LVSESSTWFPGTSKCSPFASLPLDSAKEIVFPLFLPSIVERLVSDLVAALEIFCSSSSLVGRCWALIALRRIASLPNADELDIPLEWLPDKRFVVDADLLGFFSGISRMNSTD
jgi:hypothetical protein